MSISEPPPGASKWLDFVERAQKSGLVGLVLLAIVLWWTDRQITKLETSSKEAAALLRADIKEARTDTKEAYARCITRTEEKSAEVKAAVKEVKAEVRATGEAVKAATPAPAPAQ